MNVLIRFAHPELKFWAGARVPGVPGRQTLILLVAQFFKLTTGQFRHCFVGEQKVNWNDLLCVIS